MRLLFCCWYTFRFRIPAPRGPRCCLGQLVSSLKRPSVGQSTITHTRMMSTRRPPTKQQQLLVSESYPHSDAMRHGGSGVGAETIFVRSPNKAGSPFQSPREKAGEKKRKQGKNKTLENPSWANPFSSWPTETFVLRSREGYPLTSTRYILCDSRHCGAREALRQRAFVERHVIVQGIETRASRASIKGGSIS